MLVGHSWADTHGIILQIDEPVADMLHRRRSEIEGRSYLDITHPADRAKSAAHIAALQPGFGPGRIRKRYVTPTGTEIWMAVEVSRVGGGEVGHLLGTFMASTAEESPRRLWREARRLLNMQIARRNLMGSDLFNDHAWTILLQVYLAEAEGRLIEQAEIGQQECISPSLIVRWCNALRDRNLIEADPHNPVACQLTHKGLLVLEKLLLTTAPA